MQITAIEVSAFALQRQRPTWGLAFSFTSGAKAAAVCRLSHAYKFPGVSKKRRLCVSFHYIIRQPYTAKLPRQQKADTLARYPHIGKRTFIGPFPCKRILPFLPLGLGVCFVRLGRIHR